jgi:predicted ribosome quality control (RQC) complex YloA/Tae2 family protein
MSPLLAREIAFRAQGHPRAKIGSIERLTPLLQVIAELLSPLQSGSWQPTVVLVDGEPEAYAPYPIKHLGEPKPMPTISRAIEAYFYRVASAHAVDGADPYAAAKRPVREAISSARTRLERRRASLVRSLNEAAKVDRWRQWGEWILAYAHTIARGDKELVADTGTGEVLHIPLDPGLSPADNAQAYFDRYRRAQRAARRTPQRLEELDLALQDLDQLETDLELVANRPEINQIRRILIEEGYLRSGKARSPRTDRKAPLSLVAHDGSTILVGRNSRQNDQVTFRQAKAEDWWFHARGVPGAHVIVRSQGQPLSPETVRQAAGVAAYFSRLRDEPDVPVDYTQRRHVRRIPGAAPGLVTYSQEQTIRVRPQGPDEISTAAAQTPLP